MVLTHNRVYFQITKASSFLNLKWSVVNTFSVSQLTTGFRRAVFPLSFISETKVVKERTAFVFILPDEAID